jgi:hypothetical protein
VLDVLDVVEESTELTCGDGDIHVTPQILSTCLTQEFDVVTSLFVDPINVCNDETLGCHPFEEGRVDIGCTFNKWQMLHTYGGFHCSTHQRLQLKICAFGNKASEETDICK